MRKLVVVMVLLMSAMSVQADKPQLLGYGVKSCSDYRNTLQGWEKGDPQMVTEYYRYRDWLTGFVSGLSLSVGNDVMRGVGIDSALRRNKIYCEKNVESDFFNATMVLLKSLRKLP